MLIYRDHLAGLLFSLAEDYPMARPTDAADLSQFSGREVKRAAGELAQQDLVHLNRMGSDCLTTD